MQTSDQYALFCYILFLTLIPGLQYSTFITSPFKQNKTKKLRKRLLFSLRKISEIYFSKQISSTFYALGILKMGQPRHLFNLFLSFQTNNTNLTTNKCEKCPSSIWRRDSNSQPSDYESPPWTTRPGLPPNGCTKNYYLIWPTVIILINFRIVFIVLSQFNSLIRDIATIGPRSWRIVSISFGVSDLKTKSSRLSLNHVTRLSDFFMFKHFLIACGIDFQPKLPTYLGYLW